MYPMKKIIPDVSFLVLLIVEIVQHIKDWFLFFVSCSCHEINCSNLEKKLGLSQE